MSDLPYDVFRFDRNHFARLEQAGAFNGVRVELIDGVILRKLRTTPARAHAVVSLTHALTPQVGEDGAVFPGCPLSLSALNEPSPAFSIVASRHLDDEEEWNRASLVIEVSDASLDFDLGLKANLYAAAKIPEYWVIDLAHQKLVVHLAPKRGHYTRISRLGRGKSVTSTVAPKVTIAVDSLFR
jgi:Uma2 family endonuclease